MENVKEKYEKVKLIYSYYEVNFDTGKATAKTIKEMVINFDEAHKTINNIMEQNDGESNYNIVLCYDLFDNESYSIRWLTHDYNDYNEENEF